MYCMYPLRGKCCHFSLAVLCLAGPRTLSNIFHISYRYKKIEVKRTVGSIWEFGKWFTTLTYCTVYMYNDTGDIHKIYWTVPKNASLAYRPKLWREYLPGFHFIGFQWWVKNPPTHFSVSHPQTRVAGITQGCHRALLKKSMETIIVSHIADPQEGYGSGSQR